MERGCCLLVVTKFLLFFFKAPSLNHKTRKIRFLSIDKQQFSNLGDNHQKVSLLQSYLTFSFQTGPPGLLMWRRMSAGAGAEVSKAGLLIGADRECCFPSLPSVMAMVGAFTP